MMLEIIGAIAGGGIIAITAYAHWNRRIFKKMGVPQAPAPPFLGAFYTYSKLPSIFEGDIYHLKKYGANGKVVGVFDGRLASLLIADPEMVKTVLVKRASDFYDRQTYLDEDPSLLHLSLINLRGEQWKHVRRVLAPTFTAGNLRKMTPLVAECASIMVEELEQPMNGDAVDIHFRCQRFTLRTIASIAFGLDIKNSGNEDNFVKTTSAMFAYFESPVALFAILLPHVANVVIKAFNYIGIETSLTRNVNRLANMVNKEIDRRNRGNIVRDDFLQSMMALEEKGTVDNDYANRNGLTRDEIIAQCVLFLAAAYETTSSALTFFCLAMAENPECQEKLREEIKQANFENLQTPDIFEKLHTLPYLEMCLHETMRVYPAVMRTDRMCTVKEGTLLEGLQIPYGMNIGIPIVALHQIPEFWPEPERFDPQRFVDGIPKEAAFAYMPFGTGPHNCIGERLAKLELRIAIYSIFKNYRVELSELTHRPVKISYTGLRTPVEPVYLRFIQLN